MNYFVIALLWAALVIGFFVVGRSAWQLSKYLLPSDESLRFYKCTEDGRASDEVCRQLEERWMLYARKHSDPLRSQMFSERLDYNAEQILRRTSETMDLPAVSVSGVDVTGLAKLASSLVTPGGWTVDLHLSTTENLVRGRMSLHLNGVPKSPHVFSEHYSEGGAAAAKNRVIDRSVFALLEQMRSMKSTSTENAGSAAELTAKEKTRALLRRGWSFLDLYGVEHDPGFLDGAERALTELVRIAPEEVDAKVLLGIVLAEKQNNPLAISVLSDAFKQTPSGKKIVHAEIGLLLAQRLIQSSRPYPLLEAVKILEAEITSLGEPASADDALLLARSHVELTDARGQLSASLRDDARPSEWSARVARNVDQASLAKSMLAKARTLLEKQTAQTERPVTENEIKAVEARLEAVQAFAEYRSLTLTRSSTTGAAKDPATLRKHVDGLIDRLTSQRKVIPFDLDVVRWLATIYASRLYDPSGDSLERARGLLELSPTLGSDRRYAAHVLERLLIVSTRELIIDRRPTALADAEKYLEALKAQGPIAARVELLELLIRLKKTMRSKKDESEKEIGEIADAAQRLIDRCEDKTLIDIQARYLEFLAQAIIARLFHASGPKAINSATAISVTLRNIASPADAHIKELAEAANKTVAQSFNAVDMDVIFE